VAHPVGEIDDRLSEIEAVHQAFRAFGHHLLVLFRVGAASLRQWNPGWGRRSTARGPVGVFRRASPDRRGRVKWRRPATPASETQVTERMVAAS
jgi:hypothetical protein